MNSRTGNTRSLRRMHSISNERFQFLMNSKKGMTPNRRSGEWSCNESDGNELSSLQGCESTFRHPFGKRRRIIKYLISRGDARRVCGLQRASAQGIKLKSHGHLMRKSHSIVRWFWEISNSLSLRMGVYFVFIVVTLRLMAE
ncbi:hypothetical protein CDAR_8461 [Caerostris darwini]|uniref:Uncharacterized protein n=1 Tax=Caerostris darwini TaxID=1538125 RepID=A0AAV4WVK1_9ARAC|nr:hypothetical protein CDAR_8461 [Caerostris darwini]